jgi:hypothetical protein
MADRWNYRRITPEEIATGHMDFANNAVLLDPGERVINIERVREIIELTEYDGIDRWDELKKELGIE